ncbi:MAG: hypothetical protein EOS70_13355 [Mesorhizobium sp.]|nr:MAG: hypothetical protein EOS70_13355 [Mesorhizobium sp.]RWD45607.1 MAG: hypothetical protein EOS35_12830 [Mesorhizobium sp.]
MARPPPRSAPLEPASSSGPSARLLPVGEKRLTPTLATSSPLGEKVAAKRPDEGVRDIATLRIVAARAAPPAHP